MLLKFCVLTKWEVRIKPLHHTAQHRDVWRKSISAVELKRTIFTPKNGKLDCSGLSTGHAVVKERVSLSILHSRVDVYLCKASLCGAEY